MGKSSNERKAEVYDPGASASFINEQGKPLLDALIRESQRGQVLIAVAFLDNALRGCILATCKYEKVTGKVARDLVGESSDDHHGILSDFGAKIPVCRVFGILDQGEYEAVEAIHKIRNLFAHKDFKITFRNRQVQGHLATVRRWLSLVEYHQNYGNADRRSIPAWKRCLNLAGEVVDDPPSDRHIFGRNYHALRQFSQEPLGNSGWRF